MGLLFKLKAAATTFVFLPPLRFHCVWTVSDTRTEGAEFNPDKTRWRNLRLIAGLMKLNRQTGTL